MAVEGGKKAQTISLLLTLLLIFFLRNAIFIIFLLQILSDRLLLVVADC